MSDHPKTIADFIKERRDRADWIERACGGTPNEYTREVIADLRDEADQLEAAWKREKAAIEADALAAGGLVEASRATTENSSEVGNAAKLREALEHVLHFDATDEAAMEDGLTDAERIAEYADHIKECQKKANAALAAPPRNCDIGTAEEQHARFVSYCDRCDCPMGCVHRKNFIGVLSPECASILNCFARWAQMPYEEGGAR